MSCLRIGYALTGSFCTFSESFEAMKALAARGHELTPIASFNSYNLSTRFGTAEENRRKMTEICGREIIRTVEAAEPIGPKKMFDILIVAPCTSNTLAKLANGINDTPVTMAVKSHLRNFGPVLIAISTNDALAAAARNIGALQNSRGYFFVPYRQDDVRKKPMSAVADFSLIPEAAELAVQGVQMQPMLRGQGEDEVKIVCGGSGAEISQC